MRFLKQRPLAKSADKQRMPVGSVKAQYVNRGFCLRGKNLLPDSQHRRAYRNAEIPRSVSIGGGGVDFFVSVRDLKSVVVLQHRKQRRAVKLGPRQVSELVRR